MINNYLSKLRQEFSTGNALEHSYRPALKELFESINPIITAQNDPSRSAHGSPDFIFINKINRDFIHGYAETKDIYINLDQVEKTEQLKRYLGYPNLILTNYLEFRFYRNGEKYQTIQIAKKNGSDIVPNEDTFDQLEREIEAFLQSPPESINSGKRLAQIMGGKAARIKANVVKFLEKEDEKNWELIKIFRTIKEQLVHDLSHEQFADMYAQTLVYGLFVARYYDKSPDDFTRREARDLIPASNPFLRYFFDHITGTNFDRRLAYIVDELCAVFSVSNVNAIIHKHYKLSNKELDKDPIIHFYEDFLKEYDPVLKKKMGAYYTPIPVVQFIIKSVDELLKKDFGLSQGLADKSTVEHKVMQQATKTTKRFDRVQILDPAVGTATFLNEVIKYIYKGFRDQEGAWKSYVNQYLITRLNGFELMMTPYTIAHLKIGLTLKETGVDEFTKRLKIYLTNSLEEGAETRIPFSSFGFAEAINEESREASVIKKETPVMVVVGNPPYSGISSNETPYANRLVDRYKVEPGGKQKLQERKHWLNDDYVKFIAMAERLIEKNREGIVALITNNGYLDNPTFRGMRWHLAKTFDKIYILDLHGNVKKNEISLDGSKDENVFDIMQGVGIILALKTDKKRQSGTGEVYHADLYGTREHKFEELKKTPEWQKLTLDPKMFYFVPKDTKGKDEYEKGFLINELFTKAATGIVTAIDKLSIFHSENELKETTDSILNASDPYKKFNIKDGRKYKKEERLGELAIASENSPTKISYRPFDNRYMYYTHKSECWINSPRLDIMQNFLGNRYNIGLELCRQIISDRWQHVFVTNKIVDDSFVSNKTRERGYVYPLYLYEEDGTKTSNFNASIVKKVESIAGKVAHEDIFDYIYAVLHSPMYREKYKGFLKIGFPRVPYPKDGNYFKELVKFGRELRKLHLLESHKINNFITTYSEMGSDIVEKIEYKNGNIYINSNQYFGHVPEVTWNFWIGGYQPAQKWLKDRKGRVLSNEEIEHYQKMIVALTETNKIMQEIDLAITF